MLVAGTGWCRRLTKAGLSAFFVAILLAAPGEFGWLRHIQTMDSGRYIKEQVKQAWIPSTDHSPEWNGTIGDKIVVMSHMAHENVSWVKTELPDWQHAIYRVPGDMDQTNDHSPDEVLLTINKGHEALGYLTYLIDHYDMLPSIMVFLHPHQKGYKASWHVDAPLHSNTAAIRTLRLELVRQRGYVNMRCNPTPNCRYNGDASRHPELLTRERWITFWSNTSTPAATIEHELETKDNIDWPAEHSFSSFSWAAMSFSPKAADDSDVPAIAATAGAQFALSREAARRRPREDYIALKEWIVKTDEDDSVTGRVFEYLWHVIFGMPGVLCYERSKCECDVYDRC